MGRYEEIMQQVREKRFEQEVERVDEEYLRRFSESAGSYLESAKQQYDRLGYGNAYQSYLNRRDSYTDLDYRRRVIQEWSKRNPGRLTQQDTDFLDSFGRDSKGILDAFTGVRDYFSQFATAEDYEKSLYRPMTKEEAAQGEAEMRQKLDEYRRSDRRSADAEAASENALNSLWYNPANMDLQLMRLPSMGLNQEEIGYQRAIDYYIQQGKFAQDREIMEADVQEITAMGKEWEDIFDSYMVGMYDLENPNAVSNTAALRNQLYAQFGQKRAEELAESWMRYRSQEGSEEMRQYAQENADSGFFGKVAASGASVFANAMGTLTAPVGYLIEAGGRTGRYQTLDPNNPGALAGQYASTVRGEIAKDIEGEEPGFARKLASYGYQGIMSAADNLVRLAMGGGTKVGSLGLAAVGSFGSTLSEASAKGATPGEAVLMGVSTAALELLTEKYSLDRLFEEAEAGAESVKDILKAVFRQAGVEASEEELSFIGGLAAEALFLREKSGYRQQIGELVAQGYSGEEARQMADMAIWNEALDTAITSAISGGVMTGASGTAEYVQHNAQVREQATVSKTEAVDDNLKATDEESTEVQTVTLEEAAKKYGPQAQAMIHTYANGQDVKQFDAAYQAAFDMGKSGVKLDYVKNSQSVKYLTEQQLENAYQAGKEAAGNLGASETGSHQLKDSGETVTIRGIASMEGGMKLSLEDGRTVEASNVQFATSEEATVYQAVAGLSVDTQTAQTLVDGYDPGGKVSAQDYSIGIKQAFRYGEKSLPSADMLRSAYISKLTAGQRTAAYEAGQRAGQQAAQEAQKAVANKQKSGGDGGSVKFIQGGAVTDLRAHLRESGRTLNATQETAIRTMEQLSAALGVDMYVYESYENSQKQRVYLTEEGKEAPAPNGKYYQGGKLYIDLNAGTGGKGTMLYTVAHELTHFIREWSPERFQILADTLMAGYESEGRSVSQLVEDQIRKARKNGRTIDFDTAFEEVVADSMEDVLTSGDVVQMMADLKQQDKTLWQKIRDWFRELAEDIKALVEAYKDHRPDSAEGQMVAQMQEVLPVLERFYADALSDASENYKAAPRAEKNTTQEGDAKYSVRETRDGQFVAVVESDILKDIDTTSWNQEKKRKAQAAASEALKQFSDGIVVNGVTRVVNRTSRREYTRSKDTARLYRANAEVFADKMRAADVADDIVIAATNWSRDGGLDHPRTDDFVDFDHGRTLIMSGSAKYSAEVVVGITSDGTAVFYDVVDMTPTEFEIKNAEPHSTATTNESIGDMIGGSAGSNVAQNNGEVKEKFSLRDSEGKELTQDQQEYFKDSKVRDEQGRLMVMYHGTSAGGHTMFDPYGKARYGLFGAGTYFTDNRSIAEGYTKKGKGKNPQVYETYLNIKKPMDMDAAADPAAWAKMFPDAVFPESGTNEDFYRAMEEYFEDEQYARWEAAEIAMGAIEDMGYDGITHIGGGRFNKGDTTRHRVFIAFQPEQIKNVDNVKPTADPDIRYSDRDDGFRDYDVVSAVYTVRNEKASRGHDLVKIGTMPALYRDLFDLNGDVYVSNEHLYQNMVSREIAEAEGRFKSDASADYHELGEEKVINAIGQFQNPLVIMESLKDYKEPRLVAILDEKGNDGQNLMAVMELYAPITYPGKNQRRNHVLITIYEKNSLPDYVEKTIDKDRILYKKEGLHQAQQAGLQLAGAVSDETLKKNVARFIKKVKAFKYQNGINYSDRDPEVEKVHKRLEKENGKLREDVEYLKEMLKLQKTGTQGKKFTRSSVDAAAGLLMKQTDSQGTKKELAGLLNGLYEHIAGSEELTWESVKEAAQPAVDWLRTHKRQNKKLDGFAQEVLKNIRGSKVYLSENQQQEAAYLSGSFNDFRKSLMGNVTVTKSGGISLDEQWQEWAGMYPSVFDPNISASDMPRALTEAIQTLRGMRSSEHAYGMLDEQELLRMVYDSYWNVSTLYTVADAKQKEITRLKNEHSKRMTKLREDHKSATAQLKKEHEADLEAVRKEMQDEAERQRKEILERHEASRKKTAENRRKTELRRKIRRTVMDLNKILNKGNKKRNVKEDMRGFASKSLELADYLFTEHFSDDDLIRRGIDAELIRGEKEAALVKETKGILDQLYDNAASLTDEEFTRLDAKRKRNMDKLKELLTQQRNKSLNAPVYDLFNDLVTEYAGFQNSKQDAVKDSYNPKVEEFLRSYMGEVNGETDSNRKSALQNMRVADMSLEELWKLHNAYTMVLHSIQTANKFFTKGMSDSVKQRAEKIASDFGNRKIPKEKLAVVARNLSNKIGWDYEKLYYALERIGSDAFTELIMNLADSEDTVMKDVAEARKYLERVVEKYGFNNWDVNKEIDREFLDGTGKKFRLTLGQLMSLYAYSRRKGAWDHIAYGGFVFGKAALTNPKPADSYKLSREQCEAITSTLTKEQKGYVEEMQKFLSETMGAKGNEVSMLLYGIEMFHEENYFPIHIAGQFKAQAQEAQAKAKAGFGSMSNAGFTHAQNPNAKAPFVLEGFNEVWADHVNEMSRYHGTVPALEDIRRVMNSSTYFDAMAESTSIKQLMENSYGKEAVDYFDNLYKEANSGAVTDKMQGASKKLLSMFRKNSVAYSASVLIQQSASLVRAYAMIDKKYFGLKGYGTITSGIAKAVSDKWTQAHTNAYNEMLKYAPGVTMAKEIGGFDTASGNSIRSYLLDTGKGIKQKWRTGNALEKGKAVLDVVDDNALANLPNVMDKIAWIEIWNACKRETLAKNTKLSPRSEEFMQAAGQRFTEVIRATQVYDSIFAKSPMLKSKYLSVQYLVSFMNEPNTVANMVESSVRALARGDVKQAARTATAVVHSIVFTGVLKSIIYALRDDDEDETFVEKYLAALTGSLISDFTVFNYLPIARDVWSLVQGYDVERADMAIVADAVDALGKVVKNWPADKDDMTEEELAAFDRKVTEANWKLAEAVAAFFGIPVKNIRREINAVLDHARIAYQNAGKTTWLSLTDAIEEAIADASPSFAKPDTKAAVDKLYHALVSGDATYAERLSSIYETQNALDNAIRKGLRANDSRIWEAAIAWNENDLERYMALAREIVKEGHFSQDNVVLAIRAEAEAMLPDEKQTSEAKAKSYFTMEKFTVAAMEGKNSLATTIRADMLATAQKNGSTLAEAESSFRSSFKSEVKDLFISGEISQQKATALLTQYHNMSSEEIAAEISKWKCQKDTGIPYGDIGDAFLKGEITLGRVQQLYVKYGGMTQEKAEAEAAVLTFTKQNPNLSDITSDAVESYNTHCESAGISPRVFYDAWKQKGSLRGSGDVKEPMLQYIDALNLTVEQKDALYLAFGWAESKLKYTPWH